MNPYWGANFWQFLVLLFKRICLWMMGSEMTISTDEVQLLTLSMLAVSCGLIGSFLILRKMSMLANSLSHTILIGIVAAFALFKTFDTDFSSLNLPIMMTAALISALLTAFFTEILTKVFRLQEDASIGLVFTGLFALGIICVTLFTRNAHIGSEIVMGNVDALHVHDLKTVFFLLLLNVSAITLFYRRFQITTFDSLTAKTLGISVSFFHYLLMFLCATTVIGAFRAVGVILVLAFLTGPYLTARLLSHQLPKILWISPLLGVVATVMGVGLSRHLLSVYNAPVSTGSLVVTMIALQFFVVFSFQRKRVRA